MELGCAGEYDVYYVANKSEGSLVSPEENKALILGIFDLFITGENRETLGG